MTRHISLLMVIMILSLLVPFILATTSSANVDNLPSLSSRLLRMINDQSTR